MFAIQDDIEVDGEEREEEVKREKRKRGESKLPGEPAYMGNSSMPCSFAGKHALASVRSTTTL